MDHLPVSNGVSGFFQEGDGAGPVCPVLSRFVPLRRLPSLFHDFRCDGIRVRCEKLALARGCRAAMRAEFRIIEEARRAHIGTVIEVLIYPVEVEKLNERLAYPPILKDGAARVEDKRIHAGGQSAFEFLLTYLAIAQGREDVSGCPPARMICGTGVIDARLECFEGRIRIPKIFIGDAANIIVADIHGEVASPIIRVKTISNTLSGNGAIKEIGATTDGSIETCRVEIALLIDMLRDHRHQTKDQRYFAVAIRCEDEF